MGRPSSASWQSAPMATRYTLSPPLQGSCCGLKLKSTVSSRPLPASATRPKPTGAAGPSLSTSWL
ncbi:MAG: hypothetical protein II849_09700 [Bacteroidales bacterium]|nr:hypothetical protein [Bacteroidales bacterium]